jgi:hypothetical protein
MALKAWPDISSRAIAKKVGVSGQFVNNVRSQVATVGTSPRKGIDGKTYNLPPRKVVKPAQPPLQKPPTKRHTSPTTGVLDGTSLDVPQEILDEWQRGCVECEEIVSYLNAIIRKLEAAFESSDLLYVEVRKSMEMNIAKLKKVRDDMAQAIPFAVCPSCQGKILKNCTTCCERGFVSEFYWNTFVPEETRNLRSE